MYFEVETTDYALFLFVNLMNLSTYCSALFTHLVIQMLYNTNTTTNNNINNNTNDNNNNNRQNMVNNRMINATMMGSAKKHYIRRAARYNE